MTCARIDLFDMTRCQDGPTELSPGQQTAFLWP